MSVGDALYTPYNLWCSGEGIEMEDQVGIISKGEDTHPGPAGVDVQPAGQVSDEVQDPLEVHPLYTARSIDHEHHIHLLVALWKSMRENIKDKDD